MRIIALVSFFCVACAAAASDQVNVPPSLKTKLETINAECPEVAARSTEENFRISRAKLGPRIAAIIVHARNTCLCGATGNCWFGVYVIKAGRAVPLLETTLVQVWSVQAQQSGGLKDIRVSAHSSATENEVRYYRFDGKRYRQSRCEDWSYAELNEEGDLHEFKKPKITSVPCTLELDE